MILKGIKGDHTLKTMLDVTCKMFGHSKKKTMRASRSNARRVQSL